jgi:hypothetical protein
MSVFFIRQKNYALLDYPWRALGVSLLIEFGLQDVSVSGHVLGELASDLN